jgi:hypothetical protein
MRALDFRHGERPGSLERILEKFRDAARSYRIRCPACGWQPSPSSVWFCVAAGEPEHFSPGCGTAWNTFQTRGRCPGCEHQWRWTACLSCGGWSRHEDWYIEEDDE